MKAFNQVICQRATGLATLFALSLAMALVTLEAGSADEPPLFAPEARSFDLDNGMTVVVIPDRRVPVVTHMMWYRAGAADEPPGASGIAHFLEHLMFKGTESNPDGRFSEIIAEIGGQENAFTSHDYTGYFQRVAREHLGQMMALEADRMNNLRLDEEDIVTERKVILEERRSRIENEPGSILSEALTAAFYQASPYGIPIIGWEHEMRTLDRDDAMRFYKRFYAPEWAILVVAGDVEVDEVRALAEATYGQIPRGGSDVRRDRPREPAPRTERRVVLKDSRARQASMQQAYLVPSYTTAGDGEAEALDLLAQILGGGTTSRLYRALVVEQKIAASAGAWYQSTAVDDTRFGTWGTPSDGYSLADVETAIETVIADVAENGITQDELDRARRTMIADAIYAQDSQASLARAFGASLAAGETIEGIQTWPRRLTAVTVDDVRAVAARYLDPEIAATGYLLPETGDPS